jgi:hypothetical protein
MECRLGRPHGVTAPKEIRRVACGTLFFHLGGSMSKLTKVSGVLALAAALFLNASLLPSQAPVAQDYSKFVTTGNKLFTECQKPQPDYCFGFITGIVEANSLVLMTNRGTSIKLFCAPEGVNVMQTKDIVLQALQDWPQIRHLPASVLVWRALAEVWPCSGQK